MNTRTAQHLEIVRTVQAPRERVWRAFADGEQLAQWWGPKGFGMTVAHLDFRQGGRFHYAMTPPNGTPMWGRFEYREIVEPERLVYVSAFSDPEGGLTRHPMWPNWPLEVQNTLTLEARGGTTVLTLRGEPLDAPEHEIAFFHEVQSGVRMGFNATFDALDDLLEREREIVVSRVVSASRERVWRALQDPDTIGAWWGPDGFRTTTHEMSVRPGGVWRYTMHGPDGTDYPNRIAYLEVVEGERLEYDHGDFDAVHFRGRITLEDAEGGTRVTIRVLVPTAEAREAMAEYATRGGEQNLARLDAFLNA